jgi:PKD repeat protein
MGGRSIFAGKFFKHTNRDLATYVLMQIYCSTMRTFIFRITLFVAISLAAFSVSAQSCFGGFTDSIDSLTLYITNQATGSYNYIEYDFGDGSWVTNVNDPTHVYAGEGIYEVCQFIMDTITWNCFDYQCDTVYIGDATCMANFWWFPDGLNVEFYSYSIGTYDSLVWDFGDGNTSSDTMPYHTYATGGTYTACLSLYDSGSMCDSACYTIFVDSNSCEASFTASANGLTVDFTNLSVGGYNASSWDFGDGFGSSSANDPSYTYIIPGTYTVCLFIYDTIWGTCFDDTCIDVTVTNGGGGGNCNANFSYDTDQLNLSCTNTSTGSYITAIWDFGDGSTPSLSGDHTYATPGTYDVCLTIGNLVPFCADQHCESITVTEFTCEPDFTYSFDPVSNVFSFDNTTTVGNVTSVKWEFGDGNSTTFANPSYTYNVPGSYEVCLNTYDGNNLCGTTCKDLEVYPLGSESTMATEMKLFPNPSDGNVILERGGEEGLAQIVLLDMTGRELQRNVTSKHIVPLHYDVPAGSYMLHVRNASGSEQVFRVVVY